MAVEITQTQRIRIYGPDGTQLPGEHVQEREAIQRVQDLPEADYTVDLGRLRISLRRKIRNISGRAMLVTYGGGVAGRVGQGGGGANLISGTAAISIGGTATGSTGEPTWLSNPPDITFADAVGDQYFSFGPYLDRTGVTVTAIDPASTEQNIIAKSLPAQLSITSETPPRLKFTDSAGGLYGPVNFKWRVQSSAAVDWLSRSTYSGVVWAHNFESAAEVDNFIDTNTPADNTTTYETGSPWGGGMAVHNIPGNFPYSITSLTVENATTFRVVTTSTLNAVANVDRVRFWNLPSPWSAFNTQDASTAVRSFLVTGIVNPTTILVGTTPNGGGGWSTTPVSLSGFTPGSGGTAATCRVSTGTWHRPMSALSSGNGQSAADRGVTVLGMPGRAWSPAWSLNRYYFYRRDYYGHPDYAVKLAVWPGDGGAVQTDNYRGSDYWVQWRVKISSGRYQASAAALRNAEALKYFGFLTTANTPAHEIVWMDRNTTNPPYANYAASDGGAVRGYTSYGSGDFGSGNAGGSMQPGGDYESTCIFNNVWPASAGACFNIQPDQWYVFLAHVIPGKGDQGLTGWPICANPANGTGIQLWVNTQTRIDARNFNYIPIFNKVGATAYPFAYDNWNASSGVVPPAFNAVQFWTYQNNYPQAIGWQRHCTQVIFKKGSGLLNQNVTTSTFDPEVDGIPCPRI